MLHKWSRNVQAHISAMNPSAELMLTKVTPRECIT